MTGEPIEDGAQLEESDSVVIQALEQTIGQVVDVEQLLRFLGFGLLLVLLAVGVRRWQRGGHED